MLDENDVLFLYANDNGSSIHLLSIGEDPEEKYKELVKEHKDDPYCTEGHVIWFSDRWFTDRVWSEDFEDELFLQEA
jgi:hypothetical protein